MLSSRKDLEGSPRSPPSAPAGALPSLDEWMQDANEAIAITLRARSGDGNRDIATFHPTFTYSMFGEDEKIFGYKSLKIHVRFAADDMTPHLDVSWSKKLEQASAEVEDVTELLRDGKYLPSYAYDKREKFEEELQRRDDKWVPPGTWHSSFSLPDGEYEIWQGKLSCPMVNKLNLNVSFLVPLFIEGGSYIGAESGAEESGMSTSEADRWTVWLLYKKEKKEETSGIAPFTKENNHSYTFIGFATVYRFFHFQEPKTPTSADKDWELPKDKMDFYQLPCRSRLSQFLILPPFQGKGKGALLYKTIFEYYYKQPETYEITVENPNEAFDDLRDSCDLAFLRTIPEFLALRFDTDAVLPKKGCLPPLIVGHEDLEKIRLRVKIAPRQFSRLLEMHLMSQLPESVRPTMSLDGGRPKPTKEDKHLEKLWQLVAKQRLYRHNKDVLAQMEPGERKEKLSETLGSVELEYARLLAAAERTAVARGTDESSSANGKRKLRETSPEAAPAAGKKTRAKDA